MPEDDLIEIVIDDVFEINCIQTVVPGVKDREASGAKPLRSESLNVFLKEFKISLESSHRMLEIFFSDQFAGLTDVRAHGSHAAGAR